MQKTSNKSSKKVNDKGEVNKREVKETKKSKIIGIAVSLIVMVIVAVFISAYFYGVYPQQSNVPISEFLSNAASSKSMNIYVQDTNNSVYVNTTYCATSIIYQIEREANLHRNPSTINFFVLSPLNYSCTYSLGISNASNTKNSTLSNCLNMSKGFPSIFINYSDYNHTRITKDAFFVYGDNKYLGECGVASELN